jgi:hypothetical protein
LSYREGRGHELFWIEWAALLLLAALAMPRVLAPIRRGWLKLGVLIGKIVSPLMLGIVFIVVFIPISGLMRLFRRDAMMRRRESAAASYWIERVAWTSSTDSLKEQF